MPSSSTSTTTSSVAATNPALNSLFTSLFTGGLGTQVGSTLSNIMSGQQTQQNTAALYKTLQSSTQQQYGAGMAQVREAAARAGLSNSTALTGQMGSYTNTYLENLMNLSSQMGLQETSMQAGVAGNLFSMLATAGNQYFTDKSTTQTSMPWTSGFSAIMGGITGLASAGMAGGGGGLNPSNWF